MDVSDTMAKVLGDMVIRSAFEEEKVFQATGESVRIIHNEAEYKAAKLKVEDLGDRKVKVDSTEYKEMHVLAVAIGVWEYMHGILDTPPKEES